MASDIPDVLSLTNVANGASIVSAPLRGNFDATQTAVNEMIAMLTPTVAGQRLRAASGTALEWGAADPVVNIVDYGAVGNGTADDTVAIQAALDAVGTGTVVVPRGTFKITSTLTVPEGVSLVGMGIGSTIKAYSCDALTFDISDLVGAIHVSKLQLLGSGATGAYSGIRVPGTAVAGGSERTSGITFDTLQIFNFGYGFRLRGLWRSCIRRCQIQNVYYGIYVAGQNVLLDIHSNNVEKGTPPGTPAGATQSVGLYVDSAFDYNPGGITEARPENIRAHHNQFVTFDVGIYNKRCLVATYDQNDLDYSAVAGIQYSQSDTVLKITNNWVAVDGAGAFYGIYGEATTGGVSKGPVVISGNMVSVIATSNAASVGVILNANQNYARVRDNYISGFSSADITLTGTNTGVVVEGNVCASSGPTNSITVGDAVAATIRDNSIAKGYSVHTGSRDTVIVGAFTGAGSSVAICGPHRAHVYRSTTQSISTAAFTGVQFATERYDNNEFHDNVTNNTRLTALMAGAYRITGQVAWAVSAGGTQRASAIFLNGVEIARASAPPNATYDPTQVVSTTWELAAGDYVELKGYQDTGSGLNVTAAEFMIERLS